ncbi:MAG: cupin domain-containing protein [Petrotogales bacterium]
MIKKSETFSNLCEAIPDSNGMDIANRYKLFCSGFSSGGFIDKIRQDVTSIINSTDSIEAKRFLFLAINNFNEMIELRTEGLHSHYSPRMVKGIFFTYVNLTKRALKNLDSAIQSQPVCSSTKKEIVSAYQRFKAAIERVTTGTGLSIINPNDNFVLESGAINLPDQGIKIVQMLFTANLGLHFAIISPGSSFYHSHSQMSEIHFVNKDYPYQHFVNGKKYTVSEADAVAMPPGVPHGGRNISDSDNVLLYFIAGSFLRGPWRSDFNDRKNHQTKKMELAEDIQDLNGVNLEKNTEHKTLNKSTNDNIIISPSQCAGTNGYGIKMEVKSFNDEDNVLEAEKNQIFLVWGGRGYININDNAYALKEEDSFSIPSGITYEIGSNRSLKLLKFKMTQK